MQKKTQSTKITTNLLAQHIIMTITITLLVSVRFQARYLTRITVSQLSQSSQEKFEIRWLPQSQWINQKLLNDFSQFNNSHAKCLWFQQKMLGLYLRLSKRQNKELRQEQPSEAIYGLVSFIIFASDGSSNLLKLLDFQNFTKS